MSRAPWVPAHPDGWYGLACWNGLSGAQQRQLVEVGTLAIGYEPAGPCKNRAQVAIEADDDEAPGPRFYCWPCAAEHCAGRAGMQLLCPT